MSRGWWLVVLLALLVGGGLRAQPLGPRVTLQGDLTPRAAAVAIADQLGVVLQEAPRNEAPGAPARLDLVGATPAEAMAAFEAAYGWQFERWFSGGLRANPEPQPAAPAVGLPLDDVGPGWELWLTALSLSATATWLDQLGGEQSLVRRLNPDLLLRAPSEAEALRLVGVGQPQLGGADRLGMPTDPRLLNRLRPDNRLPLAYRLLAQLDYPALVGDTLPSLGLELSLIDLEEHVFVFDDLTLPGGQTQSEPTLDVTLTPGGQNSWQLTMRGEPPAQDLSLFRLLQMREGMVVAVVRDAAGAVLRTMLRLTDRRAEADGWEWAAALDLVAMGPQPAVPATVEVTVLVPVGQPRSRWVEFRQLPLPPLH